MRDTEVAIVNARNPIRQMVIDGWPELAVRWHPDAAAILAREGLQLTEAITHHASFAAWEAAQDKLDKAFDKDTELERGWVKVQRFLSRAENRHPRGQPRKGGHARNHAGVQGSPPRSENETLTAWK